MSLTTILKSIAVLHVVLLSVALAQGKSGLVAHYSFDKGQGTEVVDNSGNGNDGRILGGVKWVTGRYGSALEFNGKDGYVDCGTGESLNIATGGTIMVWCKPATAQGGLVCWNTGEGWPDERLILAVSTYRSGPILMGCFADGKTAAGFTGFNELALNQWTLLAFSFDGKSVAIYHDGLLNETAEQNAKADVQGVPLWLGRCRGLGAEYFHGLMDEVRIYDRTLTADEIFAYLKSEAAKRRKDMSLFKRVGIQTRMYPDPARMVVTLDHRGLRPLPVGTTLRALLMKPGEDKPVGRQNVRKIPDIGKAMVIFDMKDLEPGDYMLRVRAAGPNGLPIREDATAAVRWNGRTETFKNVEVLNNLCWELLNLKKAFMGGIEGKNIFTVPIDRWVYIRTTAVVADGGRAWAGVDSNERDDAAIVHEKAGRTTLDAMRYLKSGQHTLVVGSEGKAEITHLIVRAIPALQYAFAYTHKPVIEAHGPYDWDFLSYDVLPNVNVLLTGTLPTDHELAWWKGKGRNWVSLIQVPSDKVGAKNAVEQVCKYWTGAIGMRTPGMDGIIIDEFGGGDSPAYDVYRQAVERIYANAQFKDKAVIPYGGTFYGGDRGTAFARACIEGAGYVAWERYLREAPDEEQAQRLIRRSVTAEMPLWEKDLPGVTQRMIMVLGYLSAPNESLNVNPSVNFKVFMEMQFRELATHPAFFGLGGIQEYAAGYCDEENVRWAGRLYRHYAIEGNTRPLTRDPYMLTHVPNPDFARETIAWTIEPAERGNVDPRSHPGYSWLQGRYPTTSMGDTFLVMKRSEKAPNRFERDLKNLTPGRLYSLKMITGDYADLLKEVSQKKLHAVSITLKDVEMLPDPKKSFQFPFHNNYAHNLGKFNRKYPYWMNYHWRVFRAKKTFAKLIVSDWKNEKEPGGPAGRELMFNFIEVQPYLED